MISPNQLGLFDKIHPKRAQISIRENHELVHLADLTPWPELITIAQDIRLSKAKAATGVDPSYRELLGAVAFAHYAPARYLCNLMDSTWTPDHITIFEFTKMLGQEAMIPYPNEVGLMKRFSDLVSGAIKKVGGKFSNIKSKVKEGTKKLKALARSSHLFAKTKEQKTAIAKKMYHEAKELRTLLADAISRAERRLHGKSSQELERLSQVMGALLPQILYFIETGFVASKKIIHLQMSELYAIVRGKSGKSVEFGLKWGINRVDGFVMGFLMNGNQSDKAFCMQSIKEHLAVFGEAPEIYGFDRGGYRLVNIQRAKGLGVKSVGIAPVGNADWDVSEKLSEKIRRERAQVEGSIGTLKSRMYGFNKPNVRSTMAMETCGQRAFLGFNLSKTLRELSVLQAATIR